MTTHTKMRKRRGHTLLEIMVVVALIGAAGVVAVGNLRQQMPAYRLDRATTQLVTDLTSARMRAISQGLPTMISFDEAAMTYSIWTDNNTNGLTEAAEQELHSLPEVPGISVRTSAPTFTFSPRGRLPSVNLYWISKLTIKNVGTHYVYVLPSGQVRATQKNMDWTTDVP